MANYGPWECPICAHKNQAFVTECAVCKTPNPAIASGSSSTGSSSAGSSTTHVVYYSEHLSAAHYVVMVLLMVVAALFFLATPLGKQLSSNIQVGLVMDFSQVTFNETIDNWMDFAYFLAIAGVIIGAIFGAAGGAILGFFLGGMIYILIVLLWVFLAGYVFPFIVNAGAFIVIGALCIAFALGCAVAIVNYGKKFFLYLNPYPSTPGVYVDSTRRYYEDKHKHREEYGRRSYFFGPGLFSISQTIKYSWRANFELIGNAKDWLADHTDSVGEWLCWIPGLPYFIFYSLSILVVGSIVTIICSLVHAIPMLIIMCIIDILFTFTWLIDRIYLKLHSIKTSCPQCQTRSVIPTFECPSCGNMHRHLVPGPYGIWHRRCSCGEVLPTTFLMGRSALDAFCPICGHELAASDVQQFSITVVGGTSSGKTVMLSAFYHEFFRMIDKNKNVVYRIPDMYEDMFDNLNSWFEGAECEATPTKQTSDMYSILLESGAFDTNQQFSLYDIAGEAFEDPAMTAMLPQKQMKDSDGIAIVIDPLSALAMRNDANDEGDDTRNYSSAAASTIISNFVTYLRTVLTNSKIKVKSDKPVAVILTKTDLTAISRRISYLRIKSIMRNNAGKYESFADARDAICREFLIDIGLNDAVLAIEANFTNVSYFPVSAMGHTANGEEYEPVHILEPFCWLIKTTRPALAELLDIKDE